MLWPTRPDTWRASALPAQKAFAAVANAIARFEPVTVGVPPGKEDSAKALIGNTSASPNSITVITIEQDDAWMRDTGPIFVIAAGDMGEGSGKEQCRRRQHVRGVDWSFNGWGGPLGGCFSSWRRDNAIASKVLELAGAERYKADMVLEVVSQKQRMNAWIYLPA